MTRPLVAEIRTDALAANLRVVRGLAPRAKVWAVVKAHGYGHGLDAVVRGLAEADGLAVVEFEAADRLRALGYVGPLLMLEGGFAPCDMVQAAEQQLSLVVHTAEQLDWLESSRLADRAPSVWIKVDTGMHRLGFDPESLGPVLERVQRLLADRKISAVGWMTHFANADLPDGASQALRCFEHVRALHPVGRHWPVSVSNSAAVIERLAERSDWVRPGIMLYGASPFADRDASALGLRAAMRLHSRIISRRQLARGEAVGYGSTFVAPQPMSIGVVACGYADGYPRHAPTGTPIMVEGVRSRIVGRVSMDMITVDLDPIPQAVCGSAVELWGDAVPVDEVARAAGTIAYELLCAIAPRVARRCV